MATLLSKAADVGALPYPPDTRLDLTVNVAVEYDLTGKVATFELRRPADSSLLYRYVSGVDSQLAISGQVVSMALLPDTVSSEDGESTLASVTGECTVVEFNLDLGDDGSDVVDYRIQGTIEVQPSHGRI